MPPNRATVLRARPCASWARAARGVASRPRRAVALAGRPPRRHVRASTESVPDVRSPREAHVPAKHPPTSPQARLSRSDAHTCGPLDHQEPSAEGPSPSVGLIGRIRDRRSFEQLRHEGRRVRTEHLWCRFRDDPAAVPPRVAFAIGRAVGPAVVRNRLRRRLRAIVGASAATGQLPAGWILIGPRGPIVERSFDELAEEWQVLADELRAGR